MISEQDAGRPAPQRVWGRLRWSGPERGGAVAAVLEPCLHGQAPRSAHLRAGMLQRASNVGYVLSSPTRHLNTAAVIPRRTPTGTGGRPRLAGRDGPEPTPW